MCLRVRFCFCSGSGSSGFPSATRSSGEVPLMFLGPGPRENGLCGWLVYTLPARPTWSEHGSEADGRVRHINFKLPTLDIARGWLLKRRSPQGKHNKGPYGGDEHLTHWPRLEHTRGSRASLRSQGSLATAGQRQGVGIAGSSGRGNSRCYLGLQSARKAQKGEKNKG